MLFCVIIPNLSCPPNQPILISNSTNKLVRILFYKSALRIRRSEPALDQQISKTEHVTWTS